MTSRKKTALIVEDSKALANMLSFLFMSRGIEVKTAKNGIDAMKSLGEATPDIIITDLMMPKMDGYELCKKVKQDAKLKHIPMIVVSALSSEENKEQLLALGADDYFQKPFEPAALVSSAEKSLKNRVHT